MNYALLANTQASHLAQKMQIISRVKTLKLTENFTFS